MTLASETRGGKVAEREGKRWRDRIAVAAVFFLNGLAMASWVSRIPAVQERLAASTGVLGLALLAIAVGALIAMPVTGWLAARWGNQRMAMAGLILLCAALPLAALAPSALLLGLALLLLGMGNGTTDVSQNAEAVLVERGWGRPIMSSFHALWSIGGVFGAALGGWVAQRGVSPVIHLSITAALVLAAGAVAVSRMPRPEPGEHEMRDTEAHPFALPSRALLAIGAVAFCSMLTEGAMSDWSGIYLHKNLHTGAGVAAAGYALFAAAMSAGRIAGDFLTHRLGPVRIVRYGGLLAAAGLGVALIVGQTWAALAGFALIGLGVAIIVPLAFSAAGNTQGMAPSAGIAAVSTTGYFGFLAGPPLIGFIAEGITLRGALGVVALLCLLVSGLARSVSHASGEPNP
ncbi:MFS transporter [Capsulimonas corticalis]|uniref:MFS transporter n=1 Tax=Capsulimonas corticalis TaxID=2219043 RepID=A0A402D5B3_9BACT|nr:MFS transporter [Capsulimonas corticalis]BDI29864.1 MFS transporter [Capsulimonas corticalis]